MAKNFTDNLNNELNNKPDNKAVNKQDSILESKPNNKLESIQDDKLVFSIPNKSKNKASTRSFNVVMDSEMVEKLDRICKKKGGYSRNELINMVCQIFVNNYDD